MGLNILPKISIITPSFNQGQYIEQCIQSVMNQGYPDFEHIVIDGGSTDNTVAILEKYPHVIWVSEPDDGQADALNKGFSIATGSVFGWINSDDFYAPNIFGDVVDNLKDYPIIMGACQLTDEHGVPKTHIVNKERGWFELLKYWVPYSIPTQPSIFFTKEVLELVRRSDELIFDTELNYCMDYDLWLRIAQSFPFSHRLDETLSYYRMTPDNKTSDAVEGMPYAEPEMSRVHRRYREFAFDCSYAMSVLIPYVNEAQLQQALESLAQQSFKDFECIVVLEQQHHAAKKQVRKQIALWNDTVRQSCLSHFAKVVLSENPTFGQTCNTGVNRSEGRLIVCMHTPLDAEYLARIVRSFEHDPTGAVINEQATTIRKVVLLEMDGFHESSQSVIDMQAQLVNTVSKLSWQIRR